MARSFDLASVADGHAASAALEAHRPHVLFLDIQMPGMSGIEVARHASGRCHVAFVTAHDEFAVAAFEQGAIDYVMKPFSTERLALTVGRLQARLTTQPANLEGCSNHSRYNWRVHRRSSAGSTRRRATTCD